MKKIFSKTLLFSLLALFFVAGAGLLLSACGHTHAFSDWNIVEATCTEDGVKTRKCQSCGYEESVVLPAGHKPVVMQGTPATCEEEGFTDGEMCSVCGIVLKEQTKLDALGHDFGAWTANGDFDLTENKNGTHSRECSRCHTKETGNCDYETEEHAATCEEGGFTLHTCTVCGNSFKHDETAPLGHSWSEEYVFVTDENGKPMHAQVCRNDRSHLNTFEECTDDGGEKIEKTCESNGYTKHTCTKCEHEWISDIEAAEGHIWDENVTPLELEQDGHFHHQKTCTVCQAKVTEICEETENYTQATCTAPAKRTYTCNVCKREREGEVAEQERNPLGHAYLDWQHFEEDGVHKHKRQCSRCEEWDIGECQFTEDTTKLPTCLNPGSQVKYCEICKYSENNALEKLDHDWGEYERVSDSKHIRRCQRPGCDAEEEENCNFGVISKQGGTCTEDEKKTYQCELCKQQKTLTTKVAKGHVFQKTIDEDAHLWEIFDEYHTRRCVNCGAEEKTRHKYVESNLCELCKHDGLQYEVVGDHAVLFDNANVKMAKNIFVAAEYQGKPVTVVEARINRNTGTYTCFYKNQYLETVVLPQSIEEIGSNCFAHCSNLKSVTIEGADLEGFRPALKKIGEKAFADCSKLTSISKLLDGLESIGMKAFFDCKSLQDIQIPDSVLEIGDHAFTNTACLNSLSGQSAIYMGKHLIKVSPETTGNFTVKEDTVSIAAEALKDCKYITKITMSGKIKEIDADAFLGCESLEAVEFLGTFDEWFSIVFANDNASPMSHAENLHIANAEGKVKIPYGITKIPAGTFKGSQVTEIEIPDTVVYVGESAFQNCASLTKISFVDQSGNVSAKRNWQHIGKNILSGTESLTQTDEAGVVYFDAYLLDASGLNTETYTVKEGTKSIALEAFTNCTRLQNITLPESLEYIGWHAFVGCDNLEFLKFNSPKGWFAYTDHPMGRMVDDTYLDGSDTQRAKEMCEQLRSFYVGDWKRSVPAA